MTDQPTYYELLGVDPKATQAEIKAAFRQNAMRNHPDQGGNPTLFRMLEEAYSTLTSPSKREEYDVWLASVGIGTPPGGTYVPPDLHDADYQASSWGDGSAPYTDREPEDEDRFEAVYERPRFVTGSHGGSGSGLGGGPGLGVRLGFRRRFETWRTHVLSDQGFLTRHGALVMAVIKLGIVGWVVFAIATGRSPIPGLGVDTLVFGLILLMIVWLFTSIALRLAGWGMVIYAIVDANTKDPSPWATGQRVLIGIGLWLAGQWLYVFRHGKWHSLMAYILMRKWRGWLRPDHRFKPGLQR